MAYTVVDQNSVNIISNFAMKPEEEREKNEKKFHN